MQTQQALRALLSAAGLYPNRRFGQHFLVDLNLMRLLVEAAKVTRQDLVLEVGCGTGSLTEALAEKAAWVVGVEIDHGLYPIAAARLTDCPNVQLLNGDVLANKHHLAPRVLEALAQARRQAAGRLLLVANLPYNVASALMINLVLGPLVADAMAVTVQREVGDRMTARPGDSHYGALSVLLQATGHLERLRVLKPSVFWPPPQVESAMLLYERDAVKVDRIRDVTLFREILDLFLGHRRKMLKTAARSARGRLAAVDGWEAMFVACGIKPSDRPHQVTPTEYVALANAVVS